MGSCALVGVFRFGFVCLYPFPLHYSCEVRREAPNVVSYWSSQRRAARSPHRREAPSLDPISRRMSEDVHRRMCISVRVYIYIYLFIYLFGCTHGTWQWCWRNITSAHAASYLSIFSASPFWSCQWTWKYETFQLALDWLVGPLRNILMAQVNNNHQWPAFCTIWFTSMNSIKVDLWSS